MRLNGNTAFALQIPGVHDPIRHLLMRGESVALLEQAVDQRGLAVGDVGDDGDVAQIFDHCVYLDQRIRCVAQPGRRI